MNGGHLAGISGLEGGLFNVLKEEKVMASSEDSGAISEPTTDR